MIFGQTINVLIKCVMSGGGQNSYLSHSGAITLTPDTTFSNACLCREHYRTNRGTESFRETDADGVEVLTELQK